MKNKETQQIILLIAAAAVVAWVAAKNKKAVGVSKQAVNGWHDLPGYGMAGWHDLPGYGNR